MVVFSKRIASKRLGIHPHVACSFSCAVQVVECDPRHVYCFPMDPKPLVWLLARNVLKPDDVVGEALSSKLNELGLAHKCKNWNLPAETGHHLVPRDTQMKIAARILKKKRKQDKKKVDPLICPNCGHEAGSMGLCVFVSV